MWTDFSSSAQAGHVLLKILWLVTKKRGEFHCFADSGQKVGDHMIIVIISVTDRLGLSDEEISARKVEDEKDKSL